MKIDGKCLIELIGSCSNKVQVYQCVRCLSCIECVNGSSREFTELNVLIGFVLAMIVVANQIRESH